MIGRQRKLTATLALLALPLSGQVQSQVPVAAPAPAVAASAPPLKTIGPRLLTPEQKRENAELTAAPESRPDRAVTPQLTIPLGRKPAPSTGSPGAVRGSKAASSGGVNDAAARCEASSSKQARLLCLDRAARDTKPR